MSGTGLANETSTVNGYVFTRNGSPGQATVAGGPSRVFVPPNDRFKLTADDNFSGRLTSFSKFVAWKVGTVGSRQIIYACLSAGGVPTWMIEQSAAGEAKVTNGDGVATAASVVVASGLSPGDIIGVGLSQVTPGGTTRMFVNGVFVSSNVFAVPSGVGLSGFCGGWDSGLPCDGDILAPTGWTRTLADMEHGQMWNGGSPWRL